MVQPHYTQHVSRAQDAHGELAAVFANLDDAALLARLQEYRWTGRQGYPLKALWRAYVGSFVLNLPHTNALIRRLEDDADFRHLCGFRKLPHRSTFNRFIRRLSWHPDLVERCFVRLTDQLKALLPDLGQEVAVDSTAVRTHSNPNRRRISDPEASWTAKNSAHAKGGKEWHFGYKSHAVVDANYGVPLAQIVTTAHRNDSPYLPRVMVKARVQHPWFQPAAVIADRGYDAASNHKFLVALGIVPVIHIRDTDKNSIYTATGVPTCLGQVPMQYVRSDPQRGHLYRCRAGGCHLAGRPVGTISRCDDEAWERPAPGHSGASELLRRDGPEWRGLYAKRQAIERCFKSLKESPDAWRGTASGGYDRSDSTPRCRW